MTAGSPPPPQPPRIDGPDAAALPAGHRLNEYEIDRTLGGGGFGITYLARDANLNLPVALKEYFPNDLAVRGAQQAVQLRTAAVEAQEQFDWGLERFLDEARALATFRHPNIVRALRYFRANGTAYIVMEYESGLALKRWVPQNAPLSLRAILALLYPLLDGLEQVHQAGFLHRDIKPDNIYVRADGSPVLLDFGSARRVSGQRDLTNIVSPGFAPFEQYHSQGHQGPWSDLYSLGAVLYWMVTGKKPVEAAARIKNDAMPPAAVLADASVFGEALLGAIGWALQPEESKRPQSVREFRAAILGAERADAATVVPKGGPPPSAFQASQPGAGSTSSNLGSVPAGSTSAGSAASHKRTLLGTILFLDLVGYSARSVDIQVQLKKLLTELIAKALRGVPEDSRIAIDTGDGAAICFMGDPEEALHTALLLRDLLGQRYGNVLSARLGLHMGPVRVIQDINNRLNVIGDGINVAQRVMDFAQPNQVLVSRAYYDVISRITDDTAEMLHYRGHFEDKHGRQHEIYAVEHSRRSTTRKEGPSTGYTATVPAPGTPAALDDAKVHEIEVELARHIGPLARVLVRKARPLAASVDRLREALSLSIPDPRAREQFLGLQAGQGHAGAGHSQPLRGSSTQSRSGAPSHPPSQPLARSSAPSGPQPRNAGSSMTQPRGSAPSMPQPSRPVPLGTSGRPAGPLDLPPEELAQIEHALSRYIGPMAKMLVRKELGRAATLKDFVAGVAANIDDAGQREAFHEAARRALHRRDL